MPDASDPRLRGLPGVSFEAAGVLKITTQLARHKTDRQRQAVVLRHVEGYSNPDIAAMLGCGVEAVESLTARGKRRLADLLRETEGDDHGR